MNNVTYVNSVLSILLMSEFYSIIQNVYAVRTGIILPEFDAISMAVKKLWDIIKKTIDSLLKTKQ